MIGGLKIVFRDREAFDAATSGLIVPTDEQVAKVDRQLHKDGTIAVTSKAMEYETTSSAYWTSPKPKDDACEP